MSLLRARNFSLAFDSPEKKVQNKTMLMVQKFHSIHEIDTEFVPNIEALLQEDVASFATLIQRHDAAPAGCVFTYFLFFGPTQNAPIGFAQLALKPLPNLLPWHKKLAFWNKDHLSWKQVTWEIGDGSSGLCVFDPKYARSGRDKVQELIREYEARPDIMAQELYCLKGLQDFNISWNAENKWGKEAYVLEPLHKAFKSYQDYLNSLEPEVKKFIKESWGELHRSGQIELGDYSSPLETPKTLPIPAEQLETWAKWGAQVLTFEKDLKVLGCLIVLKGRNGNVFFEPFPFEPEGASLVHDELYTQYALIKFFEMPEARKCHLMKFGSKLVFEEKEDLKFFQSQGFQLKTVVRQFQSRLKELTKPL
jgi:hypothetical protein